MTLDNPCHRPTTEKVLIFLQPPPAALSSFFKSCPQGMHQSSAFVNVPTIIECGKNYNNKTIETINTNDNIKEFGGKDQHTKSSLCNNDTNCSKCLKE